MAKKITFLYMIKADYLYLCSRILRILFILQLMHRNYCYALVLACLFAGVVTIQAKPRTKAAMENAAVAALTNKGGHAAPVNGTLKQFAATPTYSVFGYEKGGYVIVSSDDLLPEILGISETSYHANNTNANFRWWLRMMDDVTANVVRKGQPRNVTKPDTTVYADAVPTLLTSLWGQEAPYNNMCPYGVNSGTSEWQDYGGGEGRCVTGCVATALSQILYYHQYPVRGRGTHSVDVKQGQGHSKKYTVDYDAATDFDWENMLDEYPEGEYTEEEGRAVAQLVYFVGVASDMDYATDGSGTFSENAVNGLVRNFGFSPDTVKCLVRSGVWGSDQMTESEVMNVVYKEINENRPVYYTGADMSIRAGHAFVLDGYNSDGLVHVNWGWDGSDNGYYNISLLNPEDMSFSAQQDMIIGISGPERVKTELDVTLEKPGVLAEMMNDDTALENVSKLKLKGDINSTDLQTIRFMAGSKVNGKSSRGSLAELDLSEARIVVGGDAFLKVDGKDYLVKKADELPMFAFKDCRKLSKLVLPKGLVAVGDGAFAGCSHLSEVTVANDKTENFVFIDDVFYTPDTTEVISVVPSKRGSFTAPKSVKKIHGYALAGCARMTTVELTSSVDSIGDCAFAGCDITELRLKSRTPPVVGDDCFRRIVSFCKLFVPRGSSSAYKNLIGWKDFFSAGNVEEFGTVVKIRNMVRKYGEPNPKFPYSIEGEDLEEGGEPIIICEADEKSPVGRYVVKVLHGTLDPEVVDCVDGILVVMQAPLTAKAVSTDRKPGQENPVFKVEYEGFKNNETEDVLIEKPIVTTTATKTSPVGFYDLVVSGGKAENYTLDYVNGTLEITDTPTAIDAVLFGNDKKYDVYTLDGQVVRKSATTLEGLKKGAYIVNGKTILIR